MRLALWSVLLFGVVLSSCQSSRFTAFRPDVSAYHSPASPQSATVAVAEPPLLEASSNDGASDTPMLPLVTSRSGDVVATPITQSSTVAIEPDTLYGQPVGRGWPQASSTPSISSSADGSIPDPATTTVNVIGGALVAAGITTLVVNSESDSGSGTNWGKLFLSLMALAVVPVGVALLLYQGVHGRQRLKREARRQARKDAAPAATEMPASAVSGPSNRPLRKVGIGLLISGALLLAIGALLSPYGLLFFGLPGLVLLISGLIISVSAI